MNMQKTLFLAGIPAVQKNLYHRIQFSVGDPAAWIQFEKTDGKRQSILVCRDKQGLIGAYHPFFQTGSTRLDHRQKIEYGDRDFSERQVFQQGTKFFAYS